MIPIPFGTDRPQRSFPWMNIALIAANVLIFTMSQSLHTPPGGGPAEMGLNPAWGKFMLDGESPRLYQFITYQFLHQGLSHIAFNMLFLYVFGNNLNEKLGHLGYGLFYLSGGVLAGCGQVLISHNQTLGASGAISAVCGLFLVLLPRVHIRIFIWILFYINIWEVPSMWFVLFKAAQDVYEQSVGGANVAYMAHIAGTVAGFVAGLLLLATKLVQRDHYDMLAMINRARRRQEYRSLVARGYEPFNPALTGPVAIRGPQRKDAPPQDPRIFSLREEISRLVRAHQIKDAAQRYLELRAIDPAQVLPPQDQLDVGNQLMSDGNHAAAAAAYEDYLRTYPSSGAGQQDQITLILAVIYAHYAPNISRARELLRGLLPRLHNPRDREMAENELAWLDAQPAPPA
jgi:membrane associated rhomboid family serine protease